MNNYTFLPWLRRGMNTMLPVTDELVSPEATSGSEPSPTDVPLTVKAHTPTQEEALGELAKTVRLYGPDDVIGLADSAIIKVHPRPGTADAEPNLLPYIEFYEEDLPWRYTPLAANGNRLRPWLMLVVLSTAEFEERSRTTTDLLPSIRLTDDPAGKLPLPDELWAWAHVQLNHGLEEEGNVKIEPTDANYEATATGVQNVLRDQPQRASARILCPRHLETNQEYKAFLIPTFERGRLAGLGVPAGEIEGVSWQQTAWGAGQREFPYYYAWTFRTGEPTDFETLVNRIEPRPLDPMVGKRWVDIARPGYELQHTPPANEEVSWQVTDGQTTTQYEAEMYRKSAILMEGPLRVPGTQLPGLLTLADEQRDPAFLDKLAALLNLEETLKEAEGPAPTNPFFHNPFFGQEESGEQAITDDSLVLPPIYGRWHAARQTVSVTEEAHWLNQVNLDPRHRMAAGLGAEVVREHQEAYMDEAWGQYEGIKAYNAYLRRLQFAQAIGQAVYDKHFDRARISDEQLLSVSGGLQAVVRLSSGSRSTSAGMSLGQFILRSTTPDAMLSLAANKLKSRNRVLMRRASATQSVNMTSVFSMQNMQITILPQLLHRPDAWRYLILEVKRLLGVEDDNLAQANTNYLPTASLQASGATSARDFLQAFVKLLEHDCLMPFYGNSEVQSTFSAQIAASAIQQQIDPQRTFNRKAKQDWQVDAQDASTVPDYGPISPIMRAPHLSQPMYEPLRGLSAEHLLANMDRVPINTYALLETNRAFIEAFMVGANHEMARELRWREYPTDQRGSYFRYFWSQRDKENRQNSSADITDLHTWSGRLGDHNQEEEAPNRMVVLLRADLLRRFPRVITYLLPSNRNKKEWHRSASPIFPSFFAEIDPDTYFVGFDLTVAEALEGNGHFFIMQERPGELCFGADVGPDPLAPAEDGSSWNTLDWTDLCAPGDYLELKSHIPTPAQREGLDWGFGTGYQAEQPQSGQGDAASMAAILLQRPVMVGVHLETMFPT